MDEIVPLKRLRLRNNNFPLFDQELVDLYKKRDSLYQLAISFNNREHQIWDSLKTLRNLCKTLLKKKMKTFFETKSTSDFKSSKDFWKFYKHVVKTKKSHDIQQTDSIIDPSSDL